MSVDELAKQTNIDNLEGDAAYVTIWQYNNSFLMLNLFYQEGMTTISIARFDNPEDLHFAKN